MTFYLPFISLRSQAYNIPERKIDYQKFSWKTHLTGFYHAMGIGNDIIPENLFFCGQICCLVEKYSDSTRPYQG